MEAGLYRAPFLLLLLPLGAWQIQNIFSQETKQFLTWSPSLVLHFKNSIYLSTYLSYTYLSRYKLIYLSIYPSIHLCVYVCVCEHVPQDVCNHGHVKVRGQLEGICFSFCHVDPADGLQKVIRFSGKGLCQSYF